MTRLPHSPGSTLVLRLNQETVHDFIMLFMPPCGPHLTPLATGPLELSLLVFSTPGGLTGDDLSRLFFTCTNTSQAATCTCNTQPRISPHNVVNHSSHQKATIHRSSNHTWSSLHFITAEQHSLGEGGGQHRGRWTGMWPRGLILAEPPPRVAGHTCDGDEEDKSWGRG
jgi:hypothetical protein